jgi:hypothetical protein
MSEKSFIESTWDSILSRDPSQIRLAYAALDAASKKVVADHLQTMCIEEGWHPEQVISAQAALRVISE